MHWILQLILLLRRVCAHARVYVTYVFNWLQTFIVNKYIILNVFHCYQFLYNSKIDTLQLLRDNLPDSATMIPQMINELINLLVTLKQNYFTFNNSFYSQDDGLATGSILSGLLVDVCLNFYENSYLLNINKLHKNKITFFSRYVDDTFITFYGTLRQIELLKNYLNRTNSNIQIILEK